MLDNREEIRKTERPYGLTNKKLLMYAVLFVAAIFLFSWIMDWI